MKDAEITLPNCLSVEEIARCIKKPEAEVSQEAKLSGWVKNPEGEYLLEDLPAYYQLCIKQTYYADHSPRFYKRLSELAIGDIYQLRCFTEVLSVFGVFCEQSTPDRKAAQFLEQLRSRTLFRLTADIYDAIPPLTEASLVKAYLQWVEKGLLGLADLQATVQESLTLRISVQIKLRLTGLFLYYPAVTAQQARQWLLMLFDDHQLPTEAEFDAQLNAWRTRDSVQHIEQTTLPPAVKYQWFLRCVPLLRSRNADSAQTSQKWLLCLENIRDKTRIATTVTCSAALSKYEVFGLLRHCFIIWEKPEGILIDARCPDVAEIQRTIQLLGIHTTVGGKHQLVGAQLKHASNHIGTFQELIELDAQLNDDELVRLAQKRNHAAGDSFCQQFPEGSRVHAHLSSHTVFRLFDQLLQPANEHGGFVFITADGVEIDGRHYTMPNIDLYAGYCALAKRDPCDIRRVYLYTGISQQYLGALHLTTKTDE